MDIYSKYAVCIPMRNKFALTTANAMRRIIQRLHLDIFGSVVQADNGTEFKGEFGDLMDEFGLKLIHGKSYTSTSDRTEPSGHPGGGPGGLGRGLICIRAEPSNPGNEPGGPSRAAAAGARAEPIRPDFGRTMQIKKRSIK